MRLSQDCLLTGSRAFYHNRFDSDYDFAVKENSNLHGNLRVLGEIIPPGDYEVVFDQNVVEVIMYEHNHYVIVHSVDHHEHVQNILKNARLYYTCTPEQRKDIWKAISNSIPLGVDAVDSM